jgi:hypothetical protein
MPQLSTEKLDELLTKNYTQAGGAGAVAGALQGAKLILAVQPFQPSKHLTVADLVQPTYTGYAPFPLTWGPAMRDRQNDIITLSDSVLVQTGAATDPDTSIVGYGLTDSTGAELLLSEMFAQPLHLVDNTAFFELIIPFAPGNPMNKSAYINN